MNDPHETILQARTIRHLDFFTMLVYPILSFLCLHKKSPAAAKRFESERNVNWIQHQDIYGRFYYEDTTSGAVTWMAPGDEDYTAAVASSGCNVKWIQHQDVYGTFYYEDTTDGAVTWMAPVREKCIA